jgi:hypothetical protein
MPLTESSFQFSNIIIILNSIHYFVGIVLKDFSNFKKYNVIQIVNNKIKLISKNYFEYFENYVLALEKEKYTFEENCQIDRFPTFSSLGR